MKVFQYFLCSFQWICVITAISMAGYWIHKYLKNEDNSIIEYRSFRESESMHLPAMSICFVETFLMGNGSFDKNNDSKYEDYKKYLNGESEFYQDYKEFMNDQKGWSIADYLANVTVFHYLKSEEYDNPIATFSNLESCFFLSFKNNFNGFLMKKFSKCFELKIDKKYSRYVSTVILGFKETIKDLISHSEHIFLYFNYPGQLTLDFTADQLVWTNPNETTKFLTFKMDSIEMIKRRNKKEDQCLEDSTNYDYLRLKQVANKAGCKAPYQSLQDCYPSCDDYRKLDILDLENMLHDKFSKPCDEIPQVPFKYENQQQNRKYGWYPLLIAYPAKMKLITQQQAIDGHALIGNIGGYIGLFLGYAIIQLPEMIHSLCHLLKRWNPRTKTPKSENFDMNKIVTKTKIDRLETFDGNGQCRVQKNENFQMNPNHEIQLKEFRKEMLDIMKLMETRIEKKFSNLHELLNDIATRK